jgi:hypothetical protein
MPTIPSVSRAWRSRLVDDRLRPALGRAVLMLAMRARTAAPSESGELAASIHATPARVSRDRVAAAVVAGTDHALAVEYGTRRMDAEPFFFDACRRGLGRAGRVVKSELR